jgi:hypothetical protein
VQRSCGAGSREAKEVTLEDAMFTLSRFDGSTLAV